MFDFLIKRLNEVCRINAVPNLVVKLIICAIITYLYIFILSKLYILILSFSVGSRVMRKPRMLMHAHMHRLQRKLGRSMTTLGAGSAIVTGKKGFCCKVLNKE